MAVKKPNILLRLKASTLKRDKHGKFVSNTHSEKNTSCLVFLDNLWNNFYKLCLSCIAFFKKVCLRAGGNWVYSFFIVIWQAFVLVWRLNVLIMDSIQFILGLSDSGNKFWNRCPVIIRIAHDLAVGLTILYVFYWIGIKITYLKNLWKNFFANFKNMVWFKVWLDDLRREDNKSILASIYRFIEILYDFMMYRLLYSFYYLLRLAYTFLYRLFGKAEEKPDLAYLLLRWEMEWQNKTNSSDPNSFSKRYKKSREKGDECLKNIKDRAEKRRKGNFTNLGKRLARIWDKARCGVCFDRRIKKIKKFEKAEEADEESESSDADFLASLETFLKTPTSAITIDDETFNTNLVLHIGRTLGKTLKKLIQLASFKGDIATELMDIWVKLNPSQKLQYMTTFLLPYISNPGKITYEEIRKNYYEEGKIIDIKSMASMVYKFITGRSIEEFLKIKKPGDIGPNPDQKPDEK